MFNGFFVNPDYSKLENENNFTEESLEIIWKTIKSKLKSNKSNERNEKFNRTASQIVASGGYNGCCDFATVFESLTRFAGIPTVHVLAAQNKWIKDYQNGVKEARKHYYGHHFCECYISGKWVLVDPIGKKVVDNNYDKENFNIKSAEDEMYYIYAKCNDIFELDEYLPKVSTKLSSHNKLMVSLFKDFDIGKLEKDKDINSIER